MRKIDGENTKKKCKMTNPKEEKFKGFVGHILTNQQFLFFTKVATDKPNQISVLKFSNQNSFILELH